MSVDARSIDLTGNEEFCRFAGTIGVVTSSACFTEHIEKRVLLGRTVLQLCKARVIPLDTGCVVPGACLIVIKRDDCCVGGVMRALTSATLHVVCACVHVCPAARRRRVTLTSPTGSRRRSTSSAHFVRRPNKSECAKTSGGCTNPRAPIASSSSVCSSSAAENSSSLQPPPCRTPQRCRSSVAISSRSTQRSERGALSDGLRGRLCTHSSCFLALNSWLTFPSLLLLMT